MNPHLKSSCIFLYAPYFCNVVRIWSCIRWQCYFKIVWLVILQNSSIPTSKKGETIILNILHSNFVPRAIDTTRSPSNWMGSWYNPFGKIPPLHLVRHLLTYIDLQPFRQLFKHWTVAIYIYKRIVLGPVYKGKSYQSYPGY